MSTLGECYKQLNSSVGQFGTATLQASTNAVESTSAGDATYIHTNQALTALDKVRDALAGKIKGELEAAAFSNTPVLGASAQAVACQAVIAAAKHVEAAS